MSDRDEKIYPQKYDEAWVNESISHIERLAKDDGPTRTNVTMNCWQALRALYHARDEHEKLLAPPVEPPVLSRAAATQMIYNIAANQSSLSLTEFKRTGTFKCMELLRDSILESLSQEDGND
jgi:hypothetical protein